MKEKTVSYNIEQLNAQYGKLPPQSVDIEEAVLGALILEADAYLKISATLSHVSFYKEEHQKIFVRIKNLSDAGIPIDMMQVTQSLKDNEELDEIGGTGYIMTLIKNVSSAGHIEYWAKIIQQKFIQRELIRIALEIQTKAYDDSADVFELIESASGNIADLFAAPDTNIKNAEDLFTEMHERIKKNYFSDNNITGHVTGIPRLDEHTGGLQNTDLTIIAAETGQGKTSLAITITNNTTSFDNPVGFLSLEMPGMQLIIKITSQETGISSGGIFKTKLSDSDIGIIESMKDKIEKKLLYVDDTIQSLSSVLGSIRYMHHKFGIKLFFIDFIQLITVEKLGQEERLAKIVRSLKNLAKELTISIVALSQLRRDNNSKTNHKPSMERLRGSGQIEEAADNIIFIWRPEEYEIESFDDEGYIPTEGKALIDFAKGRNIGTTKFIVKFIKEIGKFYEKVPLSEESSDPDEFTESREIPF